ncbi:hypothetical protein BS17DRAFT_651244, partial [Gyrodon lividus]
NAWIPGLTVNACCNNDGQLLTNSQEMTNISFYVTAYQRKKTREKPRYVSNLSQRICISMQTTYLNSLCDQQRLLLFLLVHAINCKQELAAPMVMSYLMGWGDTCCSHHYVPIYWSLFVSALIKTYPELQKQ